jgi:ABC-type branched-subunit amino acid transport system substrate-binding protein
MSLRPRSAVRGAAVVGAAVALTLGACASEEPTPTQTTFEGVLKIGTILPQTGNLAFLGPPEFAGVDLAIKEINEAGGVWGNDVVVSHKDSGDTTTDIASQSAEALIQEGVHAVIGAASSGVSFTFIDRLYEAEVIQVSPANTSPDFTDYENGDFYFRTAPSDVLQGRVLGDLVLEDGHENVAIMALQDAYGLGLLQYTKAAIEDGGGTVVAEVVYDPAASEFSSEVATVAAANPDAIVLITFNEIVQLAPALINANLGPSVKPWYFVDGNLSNYGDDFPAGTLLGTKGTLPGAAAPQEFQDRLLEVDPDLNDFSYAGESYDATILVALAAIAANSDDTVAIRDAMVSVSRDGQKCTTFAQCKALLEQGVDIDYDGVSGPVEWSPAGDPTAATIGIYEYGEDNTYTNVAYRSGQI